MPAKSIPNRGGSRNFSKIPPNNMPQRKMKARLNNIPAPPDSYIHPYRFPNHPLWGTPAEHPYFLCKGIKKANAPAINHHRSHQLMKRFRQTPGETFIPHIKIWKDYTILPFFLQEQTDLPWKRRKLPWWENTPFMNQNEGVSKLRIVQFKGKGYPLLSKRNDILFQVSFFNSVFLFIVR